MKKPRLALLGAILLSSLSLPAMAESSGPAPGVTETISYGHGIYLFRYNKDQSLFVVTPDGVIVTDPIGFNQPEVGKIYLAEIRKITKAPIRYLVYSHTHYDHIGGGRIFKDAGAIVIAHENALKRLEKVPQPQIVMPDFTVPDGGTRSLTLGGTTFEMLSLGASHSDTMLVFRLPAQDMVFTVDWISVGEGPGAYFGEDMYPLGWEKALERLLAVPWTKLMSGHPTPNGRFGTRDDVEKELDYYRMLRETSARLVNTPPASGPPTITGGCSDEGRAAVPLPRRFENYVSPANFQIHLNRYCIFQMQGF